MALHPPKQETAVVTPAGAAAANAAAAAGITPTLVTRISLLEYICANDFDPSVTGLSGALVGARCTSDDGTKCWQKWGAANANWRALHETRSSVTASGGPLMTLTLPAGSCNVPTKMSVDLFLQGTGGSAFFFLQIDGAASVAYGGASVFGPINGGAFPVGLIYSVGKVATLRVNIGPSIDGKRSIISTGVYYPNGVTQNFLASGYLVCGEIAGTMGISTTGYGNILANGFILAARVYDDWTP